jgi:hypothetical protein
MTKKPLPTGRQAYGLTSKGGGKGFKTKDVTPVHRWEAQTKLASLSAAGRFTITLRHKTFIF